MNRFLRAGVGAAGISIRGLLSISATVIESSDLSRPQLNRESIKTHFAPAALKNNQLRKFSTKRVKMVSGLDVRKTLVDEKINFLRS